jgi:hypothetical protein
MKRAPDDERSIFDLALDITAKVSAAGYGLLPEQPSATMLAAGVQATGLSLEQVRKVYRAMHQTALSDLGAGAQDPIMLLQSLGVKKQAH